MTMMVFEAHAPACVMNAELLEKKCQNMIAQLQHAAQQEDATYVKGTVIPDKLYV